MSRVKNQDKLVFVQAVWCKCISQHVCVCVMWNLSAVKTVEQ